MANLPDFHDDDLLYGEESPRVSQNEVFQGNEEPQQPKKLVMVIVGLVVCLISVLFIIFALNVAKKRNTPSTPVQEITTTVEAKKKTDVTPIEKPEVTREASESQVESKPEQPKISQEEIKLPTENILQEVLENKATVVGIDLVQDNDLLANYKITVRMGSTNLSFKTNYDQAHLMSVGDNLIIKYSKVSGYDKVIIRSLDWYKEQ